MSYTIKVILVGDGAVGKTTLRKKYMGETTSTQYLQTLGADISVNDFIFEDNKNKEKIPVKILIWDIAGQPAVSEMHSMYYKGAHAIFLVYDITNYQSYQNIENWIANVSKNLKIGKLPIMLLNNKVDYSGDIVKVNKQDGEILAKKLSKIYTDGTWEIPVVETSALTGKNVDLVFNEIVRMVFDIQKLQK
ncbi:MAG: Transforming protein p29 precursor [Candidatus Heimdallarchaeota archaeon LC_3]|nr:MAG: Transforming protein p29 precursor [Candidatus Heimdallarchaeota archaeon LC_3]